MGNNPDYLMDLTFLSRFIIPVIRNDSKNRYWDQHWTCL